MCVCVLLLRCAVAIVYPAPDCSDLELRYVPDGESATILLSLTPSFIFTEMLAVALLELELDVGKMFKNYLQKP